MRKVILVALAVLILAAGVGVAVVWKKQAAPAPKPAAQAPESPQTVDAVLAGTIQSRVSVKIGVPISGRIHAFHAEIGDEVYEGQLLAEVLSEQLSASEQSAIMEVERLQERVSTIEGTLAAARLEASRASADALRVRSDFDRATRAYERQKLLLAEGATPRLTFEKSEKEYRALEVESKNLNAVAQAAEERVSSLQRDLDSARKLLEGKTADLEAAKARVEAGQIVSPATGIISARRGQPGEEVNPAMQDLFVIATDTSQLDIILEPDPALLPRIKPGQSVGISLADVPNETLPGTVSSVENGRVTIEFSNPSPLVKPGMSAQVRIRLG